MNLPRRKKMGLTIRNILSLFAALAMLTFPALAQESPANRISAMDIFHFQYALDPQISPDGSKIVYVRRFADVMSDKRDSNLWIVNADGSENRPLTTGNYSDDSPKWSPDGTRLAYISDRDGKPQLYVRWMDTGQTAKITDLEFPPMNPVWSPDGKQIAFSSLVLVPGSSSFNSSLVRRRKNGAIL